MDIVAIEDLRKENSFKGVEVIKVRWLRRTKLTPYAVMTCFVLPYHMLIRGHVGDKKLDDGYLHNFVDLLIVDEAGQTLPEVVTVSFALMKRALMIDDTEQIVPIWNSLPCIGIGNMVEEHVLPGGSQEELTESYVLVYESGRSATSGNVMKIAQFNPRYQYGPDLAQGVYLHKHRRYFNNIIGYCNTLSYHGKLRPKRRGEKGAISPAMGYLHIDDKGMQTNDGGRYNDLEARTVTAWLATHKEEIEYHYSKLLHELVGIVTPFPTQVSAIKSSLLKLDIDCSGDENSPAVRAVRSLQRAERAIVLFSPVYPRHENSRFIGRGNNMLNVAVSRAKDSFLVLGDMDLLKIQPTSSPGRSLSKYPFISDSNTLQLEYEECQDLNTVQTQISILHGVEQHDVSLNQTFDAVGKGITTVSPWLTWKKSEQTGFLTSTIRAHARGTDTTVVTDKDSNTQDVSYEKCKAKQ